MTIGTLTAFTTYLGMLIWPMIAFGWVTNLVQQGAASMGRLASIMDTEPEIQDTERTDRSIENIYGTIEFRNVSFTHKNTAQPTLKNINLKIESGMTVAVVGYTGTGKSTLINLIPRLYDITGGELFIDGVDIRKIPLEVLRSNIGFVPQETFLFSETIAENIRYGIDNRNEKDLNTAAEISQIAKEVMEFPKQYETMIGERGITLSGGQKQRSSIARAIMRNPKILILDDALSAVDTYTEERILHRLREFMKGRTSIIISHRISTVKDADLIVVLQNGEIVERGTHDDLVAFHGIYADLHHKQLLEQELESM
jgi:ATP-binding cassette subfamily B protein